ncbi:MAG: type I-F CRISPR-associated endoribonuclease Cas6/Csy4 [Vibrio fluvialis]
MKLTDEKVRMNYYQDITLLPDADIPLNFLWSTLFQQVHIALVEHKVGESQSEIAVSFPDYQKGKFPLGTRLRLFAETQEKLDTLNIGQWLSRLQDYSHVKSIKTTPDVALHVSFVRQQVKSPK